MKNTLMTKFGNESRTTFSTSLFDIRGENIVETSSLEMLQLRKELGDMTFILMGVDDLLPAQLGFVPEIDRDFLDRGGVVTSLIAFSLEESTLGRPFEFLCLNETIEMIDWDEGMAHLRSRIQKSSRVANSLLAQRLVSIDTMPDSGLTKQEARLKRGKATGTRIEFTFS